MIVAATGFFDGVHSGHRMVIDKAVALARENNGKSLVVTFWPHPRNVLQLDADKLRLLTSLEEKRQRVLACGVDEFVVLPFTRDFSSQTASEFLSRYLIGRYGVTHLVLGYDHHLGSDDVRDVDQRDRIVRMCGIVPVPVSDSISASGRAVSSTMIREILSKGDVVLGGSLLGYRYALDGVVVSGQRIGRTIGFPTANLSLYEPLKLIPAGGVYVVCVTVLGKTHLGICNIGTRPTLGDGRGQIVETHILDFDEEIYGLDLRIEFISRLRDEQKFDSLEDLKKQLKKDLSAARKFEI